jgi:eukaryotic-like serine/threonine-protein kinase
MAGPRTIGRFELQDEVASGASGTIYQARDVITHERVALKLIRGIDGVDAARFEREAQVLAQLRHPGVVRYVEHGRADGGAWLAMEWLDGEDLRVRLGRAGLSMNETMALGRQIAGALAAVHALGLVHRDVKPGNIFLVGERAEEAKIIDFGLARADDGAPSVTQTGLVVGTPAYMAPEQARGQRDLDGRADIFSLGCVLFKCLTGRPPFQGHSVMAVLTKVVLDEPPRVRELRPEVPAALDELVARMLQKDPAGRPATAAAVVEALVAVGPLGEAGDAAEPAPPSRVLSGLTGGEHRVMAMLFVGAPLGGDTRAGEIDSGTRATLSGPEGQAQTQSPPLEAIGALAREHGAHIDRLADGTSVVTLVGAGVATDQAAKAARLALALRAVLPGVPMALATGRGDVARRLPVGDAIERAALLLGRRADAAAAAARAGLSPPTSIAVDAVTAALLGGRFDVIDADGGLSLEGLREVEPGARTLLGRSLPMLGRDWELSSIESLFFECVEDPLARPVLVTAPAGMGKSRLGREVVRALRRRLPDLRVWAGRGDPLRAGSALGLLGEVLRNACDMRDREPLEGRQRRLSDRAPPGIARFLGEMVDAPFPDESSVELRAARQDPYLMSEQLHAAWEGLLATETEARPVLVLLEDLHWADAATVRFIDRALRSLERRPWMVLALARPEVHDTFPKLWAESNVQEIRLGPLPRRAGEKLVRQALGDGVRPETVARLVTKAEGNAFYLEELIRAVADDRRPSQLPETVLAMVQARLEGLDPESRRVLRAASVFGEVFWVGGVAALLGGGATPPAGAAPPAPQVAARPAEPVYPAWADGLVARELLTKQTESRFAGERQLSFRHALLREGAYATLTEADRALGHQLAGEWLEAHGEGDAMVLAQHFDLAGAAPRAGAFYLAAAGQALRSADPGVAIERAERALARGSGGTLRTECLSLLAEAYAWRNDWRRSAEYAAEVIRLTPPGSVAWIHAQSMVQTAAFLTGQIFDVLEVLATLERVDPAPEAAAMVLRSLAVGMLIFCLVVQFPRARDLLGRIDAVAAPVSARDPVARGWWALAHTFWSSWHDGDLWAALVSARAAEQSFAEVGDARQAHFARLFVANCEWMLGMTEDAERDLQTIPGASGDHLLAIIRTIYLAPVLAERGAFAEARELAEQRMTLAKARLRVDDELREAEAHWLLGEIAALAGDPATAEREITAGLGPLETQPLSWQSAAARLAQVKLALGKAAEALPLAKRARDALRGQGGYGQRGTLVRLVYAEALEATGDHAAARAELAAARDDLQARAAKIADDGVRRGFLAKVAENARVTALAEAWLGA